MLEVHQFACLSDNYGYLLHDPASGETACIDTPDAEAYLREAGHKGWQITQIWNTHWHPDHAGGNAAIKAATGCTVIASAAEAERTAAVDRFVAPGEIVALGDFEALVIDATGAWIGIDNNNGVRADGEVRPIVWRFAAPQGGWSSKP